MKRDMVFLGKWRVLSLGCALAVFASFLGGCAHRDREFDLSEYAPTPAFAPQPPPFLKAGASILLTNTSGFVAHATIVRSPNLLPDQTLSGSLLGRGSKLLFAPDVDKPLDKRSPAGGFSYIWDAAENRGWMLSEALQGYAPISSTAGLTNVEMGAVTPIAQRIDGHPCEGQTVTVALSNGTGAVFHLIRAADLQSFPLEIDTAKGPPLTVRFSKIRLEAPPAQVFAPPDGFTKYSSAEAMVDELAMRQRNLRRGHL